MKSIVTILIILLAPLLMAHDYVPGEAQKAPILLKGGTLNTVSGAVMENTDLLFEEGRITQIGADLVAPPGTEVIDVSGKQVYPGLIAPVTNLGLTEIGAVRATNDSREIGSINPNVQAHIAYDPDSEIIPTVRAGGITTAQITPRGSLITGQSSILNLDGWTYEDCVEKLNVGLHIMWPGVRIRVDPRGRTSVSDQRENIEQAHRRIYNLFDDARSYYLASKADRDITPDTRWDAMIKVLEGRMPVFIHAGDYRQIEQAVAFAREQGVRMVLVSGRDSWMLTDLLKENDVPVIIVGTQSSPPREDDPHDLAYQLPGKLEAAGVKFCIAYGWTSNLRNLPFQAGQAIPYGLSHETALRALTLSSAEILGIDDDLGSLEVGKKATLIVSEGDILDLLGHKVTMMFIEGRSVDLDTKHKELFRKYSQKKP